MIVTNLVKEQKQKNELHTPLMEFAQDIDAGLSSTPKKLSSKYFYDEKGSQIFQEITRLDEYYLTRAELSILENIKNILPDIISKSEIDIVELGVGDGHKTKIIIDSFLKKNIKVNFYPIDISAEAFHQLSDNIKENDHLIIHGIVAEYIQGMSYVRKNSNNRQVVLFLGSNIGNFTREESQLILKKIRSSLKKDDFMLIGFDLKKDIEVLTSAYSDHEGITARFNLNMLERINHELGADFSIEHFKHLAQYNPVMGAMESFLISQLEQTVTIEALNKSFHFDAFEPIHMEYSFKYLEQDISDLSLIGGFTQVTNFSDANHYYVDSLWQVT